MKRLSLALLLLAAICAFGIAPKRPNVVLITVDTLRADRVGCYGYRGAQTPTLDRLGAEGIQFTNATSHVPLTRPSHTSIFTGLYPYLHNVHDNVSAPLDPKIPTLAELMKKNGYNTAAFVAAFVVNSQSGLNRGFDIYEDQFNPEKQPTEFALNLEKRGEEIFQEFAKWNRARKAGPYFAWIHLYDPHFPYAPPPPFAARFKEHPYDGEVAYSDSIVARILKLIDPARTLLIVTSDHGESLGDHGENAHSFFIYDSTLHVPLIFHWPGEFGAGRKVNVQVRLVDLFPTVLDLLDLKQAAKISGNSLKPWLLGENSNDPKFASYSETFTPWLHFGWSRLQGVRTSDWKYIQAPKAELYNLTNDPQERTNLARSNEGEVKELHAWLSNSGALLEKQPTAAPTMDPETLEKLASLGYAGVAAPTPATGNLPDPKDKIEDFKLFNKLIRDGIEAFRDEKYQQAAASFQQLEDRKIPSFEVHYYLGRSLLRLKSYDKASTELRAALQKLPHFVPAYADLAESYEGLRKPAEAEKALLAGLSIAPNHPTLVQPLAWFYQRNGKPQAAEKVLLAELKEHPDDVQSRFRLGAIYRDTGRTDAAMEQFREAIRIDPANAEAHNQLGMLLGGSHRIPEAIAEFQEANRLNPKDDLIRKNLEIARGRAGDTLNVRFLIIETKSLPAAQTIWRKLQAGVDWSGLAREYSVHPSARMNNPVLESSLSDLAPSLAKTLASLKPGEFSKPVSSATSYFILKRE